MLIHTALLSLFIFTSCLYLAILIRPMLAVSKWKSKSNPQPEALSILVCARNEAENLAKNLPLLLSQRNVNFELVIVDDASWDSSAEILDHYKKSDSKVVVVKISEEQKRTSGKKMALTLAIKRAKYECLLLTDADCEPESELWAYHMSSYSKKGIVLGYGAYKKGKGLLNKLIRYDTWSSSSQFLGSAIKGHPYIGVGRNLGYHKEVYEDASGFKKHYHLMSGDDDLLINQVANPLNCEVCLEPGSFTYTDAPSSWKAWLRKKTRHLSTSPLYKKKTKTKYALMTGTLVLFYVLFTACLLCSCPLWYVMGVFIGKTLIQMLISMQSMKKLKEVDLLVLLPMLEPLNLMVNTLATIRMRWSKTIPWK